MDRELLHVISKYSYSFSHIRWLLAVTGLVFHKYRSISHEVIILYCYFVTLAFIIEDHFEKLENIFDFTFVLFIQLLINSGDGPESNYLVIILRVTKISLLVGIFAY